MNINYELFQMDRINEVANKALAQQRIEPRELIEQMTEAVHQFVGEAEQSDDLTMMGIQFIKKTEPSA
jgi:sigma-B regulation protein RsbU (phosphoserine phosphatase)